MAMIGCSDPECDLTLEQELRARAGADATDCGVVTLDEDAESVDACVVDAFSSRAAFHAQYEARGIDSMLRRGIVGNTSGEVTFLDWDGYGGASATAVSASRCDDPAVNESSTPDPSISGPLACSSTTLIARACD
jgi:hypothetical protein